MKLHQHIYKTDEISIYFMTIVAIFHKILGLLILRPFLLQVDCKHLLGNEMLGIGEVIGGTDVAFFQLV